jgi:hypothetical protein
VPLATLLLTTVAASRSAPILPICLGYSSFRTEPSLVQSSYCIHVTTLLTSQYRGASFSRVFMK